MSSLHARIRVRVHPLLREGLLLFFPAAALHALVSPLAWVGLFGLVLPFADAVPSSQWHAYEMIFGTYGAALAGFLASAIPEWTDTRRRSGRELLALLGLWLPGRLIGLVGAEALLPLATVTDLGFMALLLWYVSAPLLERRSLHHASFAAWVTLLLLTQFGVHLAWLAGATELAGRLLAAAALIFLVLFSLSLSRINVVVMNLALDPSGETTPYRPHPGRRNLAGALVSAYVLAALLLPDSAVPAWLALAAGAAFLDRLAEWFIGPAVLRTHVLALAGANAFAGAGLLVIGAAGLGAPLMARTGLHLVAAMGLGLSVMAVFIIAGLRHTGRTLDLPWQAHAAVALMAASGAARVLPELGVAIVPLGLHYLVAALLWSAAFGVWLAGFLPLLQHPLRGGEDGCAGH